MMIAIVRIGPRYVFIYDARLSGDLAVAAVHIIIWCKMATTTVIIVIIIITLPML